MKEIVENNTTLYQCDACKLAYKERDKAVECEAWCKENNSCNLDIIQYAEPLSGSEKK